MVDSKLMKWDKYFMGITHAVAKKSPCLSRQLGAILVRDKRSHYAWC